DRLPGQRALHADAARRRPLRSGFFRACAIVAGSVAGWSSLVARWAHNPKVVGSNPAPATKNSLTKTTTQRMANADPKVGVLLCDEVCDEVCVVTNLMKSERALLLDHWARVD